LLLQVAVVVVAQTAGTLRQGLVVALAAYLLALV
jgi:hypothetical protein